MGDFGGEVGGGPFCEGGEVRAGGAEDVGLVVVDVAEEGEGGGGGGGFGCAGGVEGVEG